MSKFTPKQQKAHERNWALYQLASVMSKVNSRSYWGGIGVWMSANEKNEITFLLEKVKMRIKGESR